MFFFKNYPSVISISRVRYCERGREVELRMGEVEKNEIEERRREKRILEKVG